MTVQIKHDDLNYSVLFREESTLIFPASRDETRVWDAQTGQALTEPMKHDAVIYEEQRRGDSKRIVTASEHENARDGDADTGMEINQQTDHDGVGTDGRLSREGSEVRHG